MKFSELASFLQKLESTSSRNAMTSILADLFKEAGPGEIDKICYLSLGRLAPLYAGIEFNLAEKMMLKVLAQAYGIEKENVRKEYKQIGDLGEVAEKFHKGGRPGELLVAQVYQQLFQIAQESGEGSVERKINNLVKLINGLDAKSAKYVVRIPLGKLRLGFSDLTIMDALSWMVSGDKSKRAEIEDAYNKRADIGQIARMIKEKGLAKLKRVKVSLGVPIMPALCQRLPTTEEMIEKMGKVAAEPKYDGTRLQIHFSKERKWQETKDQLAFEFRPRGFVRTFTRNLENTTHMFPDLVEAIFREVEASEAILDSEAIGFNPKTGRFLPFQETIKRKRKYEIGQKAREIPLKFFCFDLLYKDGQDLLKTPFDKRREILEEVLTSDNKTIILSPQIVTDSPRELRRYHNEQIEKGLEGVVIKRWQSEYEPGRRGYNWVKFKQEKGKKGGGLADTLDCVVMGYYKGKGKRAGFGVGGFLVGIREGERSDQFMTLSKIGTGLSDEQWREMKKRGDEVAVKDQPKEYQVDKNLFPDVWCSPRIVVEIEADNITKSPIHTAKYALRFPRLVRFRDDKSPKEATTLIEAEKLYKLQK